MMAVEGEQTVAVEAHMSADMDVIPAPKRVDQKDWDDLNLLIAMDEPEQVVRALLKVAETRNGPKWIIVSAALREAGEMLEEENKPSR